MDVTVKMYACNDLAVHGCIFGCSSHHVNNRNQIAHLNWSTMDVTVNRLEISHRLH